MRNARKRHRAHRAEMSKEFKVVEGIVRSATRQTMTTRQVERVVRLFRWGHERVQERGLSVRPSLSPRDKHGERPPRDWPGWRGPERQGI